MKTPLKSLKTTGMTLLSMSALTLAVTATSSVQAYNVGEYQTVDGTACVTRDNDAIPNMKRDSYRGIKATADNSGTNVYVVCPLEIDTQAANKSVRVYVYADKAVGSTMKCRVYANHYFKTHRRTTAIAIPEGKNYSSGYVSTYGYGTLALFCELPKENDVILGYNYAVMN